MVSQDQHAFILANGKSVKNLLQLAEVMHSMHEDVYSHHANEERNDFSTWVNDVFREPKLASRIQNASREQTQMEIYRFLSRKLW